MSLPNGIVLTLDQPLFSRKHHNYRGLAGLIGYPVSYQTSIPLGYPVGLMTIRLSVQLLLYLAQR